MCPQLRDRVQSRAKRATRHERAIVSSYIVIRATCHLRAAEKSVKIEKLLTGLVPRCAPDRLRSALAEFSWYVASS